MKVTLADSYGFCEGVRYALNLVRQARAAHPEEPMYLLGRIVHNDIVTEQLRLEGIHVIDTPSPLSEKIRSVPSGTVVFSAHGHDEGLDALARSRNLTIIDATCPRVRQNHRLIRQSLQEGKTVYYIGIPAHPETDAALSISPSVRLIDFRNPSPETIRPAARACVHNQTTLIQEELEPIYERLRAVCSSVEIVNDICFATALRQKALRRITDEDLILIVGDRISSNSTRLYEIAAKKFPCRNVLLVSSVEDVRAADITGCSKAFVTAGASTPDEAILPIIEYLKAI